MASRLSSFLFLLLSLLGYRAQAQVYEPGWLVRTNGDTLRGELENGFWEEAPTFVRYRPAATSASRLFQARQVRAFGFVGGRHFRHEFLSLDQAAETRLQALPKGNHVEMRADSVLAEVLLTGPAELLRVVRPGAAHYEVRRPGRPPLSLSERKYLAENKGGGTWSMVDGNNYRNQLALYFADCPAASQAADRADFTGPGLAAVVQAYATACSPARQPAHSWAVQAPARRRGTFQGGVLAGARYNRLVSPAGSLEGCTDCGLHPFGGFYAEWTQPSRTTAFYGELSLSTFRNRGVYLLGVNQNGSNLYETFDYRALLGTARLGVRFLPPLPHDQHLIVGLGFEYNRALGLSLPSGASNPYSYLSTSTPADAHEAYPFPTFLPNLTLGWCRQRLTLLVDGQLYRKNRADFDFSTLFFSNIYALRLGASYRLGRNPDAAARP